MHLRTVSRNADINDELKALKSPLADFPCLLPFSVPEGYFDTLAATLAEGVHFSEMEAPEPSELPLELPFHAPEFYFEKLPGELLKTAKDADFTSAKAPAFAVPAGYFEGLPDALLAAARNAGSPVAPRRTIAFAPAWKRWAVAAATAVCLLSLGLGGYRYYETHTPEAVVTRQLSRLDQESIAGYIEQHLDEFDAMALESVAAALPAGQATVPALNPEDIRLYLEESGEAVPQNEPQQTL